MKNFKELATKIGLYESGEHSIGGGVQFPSATPREVSAVSDEGVYNIQRKSQLNRINAFLDAFSSKEYIEPRAALGMLRAKLNIAGLDFDYNATTKFNDEGETRFPITRFGGAFGKSLDTPFDQFDNSDGISEYNDGKGFELVLNVTQTSNGVSRLDTKLEETTPAGIAVIAINPVDDDEKEQGADGTEDDD